MWIESGNSDTSYYKEGSTDPSECLILPYNPMINSSDTSFLTPIYQQVIALQNYTPMKLTTWTDAHYYQGLALNIQVSNMVWWSYSNKWMKYTVNDNGVSKDYYCPIFSWELSPSGLVIEGTGNPQRQYDSGYTYEQEIVSQINEINDSINDRFRYDNFMNANLNNPMVYSLSSGIYLFTYTSYGSSGGTNDGMWLVHTNANYAHCTPILTPPDGTTITASPNQVSMIRGSAKMTVTVTRIGGK